MKMPLGPILPSSTTSASSRKVSGTDAGVADGAFVGRWVLVNEISDFKFDGAVAIALDDGAGDDFASEFETGVGKFDFARFQFGDGEIVQRHFFRAVHDHGEQADDDDGKSSDEFYFFGGHFNLRAFLATRWGSQTIKDR